MLSGDLLVNSMEGSVAQSTGQSGKPETPAVTPAKPDGGPERPEDTYEDHLCHHCGGDGLILASDGDGSDWGEDTYSGPDDEVIQCRHCNGTGAI